MSLVIGPFDGLRLEGVPCLDVGLVGVTSKHIFFVKHTRRENN